jgi:hypothetical protein
MPKKLKNPKADNARQALDITTAAPRPSIRVH